MTPTALSDTVNYIGRMFPAADWTPELRSLFIERAGRIDLSAEQAKAVVGEYRTTVRAKSPDVGTLLRRLHDAAHQTPKAKAPQAERAFDPEHDEPTGWEKQLLARWEENRADPVFIRLRKRMRRCGYWEHAARRWRALDGTDGPYDLELEQNDPVHAPKATGGNMPLARVPVGDVSRRGK